MSDFRKRIARLAFATGTSIPAIALKMNMNVRTLYRRLDDPVSFTFDEMNKLFDILNFTEDEKDSVILDMRREFLY